jgi:hypothetical protein
MKTEICTLEHPAKCTRCQYQYKIPFAKSEECKECKYKKEAEIQLCATNAEK